MKENINHKDEKHLLTKEIYEKIIKGYEVGCMSYYVGESSLYIKRRTGEFPKYWVANHSLGLVKDMTLDEAITIMGFNDRPLLSEKEKSNSMKIRKILCMSNDFFEIYKSISKNITTENNKNKYLKNILDELIKEYEVKLSTIVEGA